MSRSEQITAIHTAHHLLANSVNPSLMLILIGMCLELSQVYFELKQLSSFGVIGSHLRDIPTIKPNQCFSTKIKPPKTNYCSFPFIRTG